MSLVKRLRDTGAAARIGEVTPPAELFTEAADEIERLQRELRDWQDSSEAYRADEKRLRAALSAVPQCQFCDGHLVVADALNIHVPIREGE